MAERRGLVAAMAAAYPAPRASMARQIASGLEEARALFYLMAACGILFVASMPNAIRTARGISTDEPVSAAIGAHLFGFLFLAPLLLYGASLVIHGIARLLGGRGTGLASRTALFWSLLLVAPVALLLAVLGAAAEVAGGPRMLPVLDVLGYAGLALWIWIFASCLAEAEGFGQTGRVVAVLAGLFGSVAALLALLSGGPGAAG
jgi:hypothetical protein